MSSEMQDLSWLAFRYVAGELSVEEEQGFENQLARDQSAREAVEEAVELYEALRITAADLPRVSASVPASVALVRRFRFAGWVVSMVLVSVLVAVLWIKQSPSPSGVPLRTTPSEKRKPAGERSMGMAEESSLALTWAEFHNVPMQEEPLFEEDPPALSPDASAEEFHAVPEWLLTAVSKRSVNPEGNK